MPYEGRAPSTGKGPAPGEASSEDSEDEFEEAWGEVSLPGDPHPERDEDGGCEDPPPPSQINITVLDKQVREEMVWIFVHKKIKPEENQGYLVTTHLELARRRRGGLQEAREHVLEPWRVWLLAEAIKTGSCPPRKICLQYFNFMNKWPNRPNLDNCII